MNQKEIKIFERIDDIAGYLYEVLLNGVNDTSEGKMFSIALSGGSTPKKIFSYISYIDKGRIDWKKVQLFWGDERCVSPDDEDSNYRMTRIHLLENIDIPEENVFRLYGESDPVQEAIRYSRVVGNLLKKENDIPVFDLVLLGLGEDGHTASIFPDNTSLFHSEKYFEAVRHPQSGQERISMAGPVINHAEKVMFIVAGRSKASVVKSILEKESGSDYPASRVNPFKGKLFWLLDNEAGSLLSGK